jgi:hypothetical protein
LKKGAACHVNVLEVDEIPQAAPGCYCVFLDLVWHYDCIIQHEQVSMKLLIVTWLLATAAVVALALRRLALSWHDHQILKLHPANFDFEHEKLRSRMGVVDRCGKTLTIAVVAYSIGLIIVLAYLIFDEAVRKLGQLIRLL